MSKYCPIKDSVCDNFCAWYDKNDKGCRLIIGINIIGESLKAINSKLIEPNLEEIQKTKEINTAIALNNIETQKKIAVLLDECSSYIKKEKAKAQLELERWDV